MLLEIDKNPKIVERRICIGLVVPSSNVDELLVEETKVMVGNNTH